MTKSDVPLLMSRKNELLALQGTIDQRILEIETQIKQINEEQTDE